MTTPTPDPSADGAAAAPVAPVAPVPGSVVLHDTYDARQGAVRPVAMIVVGSSVTEAGETHLHGLSLGWADEFAELAPGDYRLPS